ncbi:hypothetical protein ACC704_07685 [Rhizobium johnstonii]|uniref:hypothetical protein n=1 Tax=Rhizobium johnstonii TaxID=3019933 RepID=UPI003F951F29
MTKGEEIFWKNARAILRDIGMAHLDLAHGAAVNIVRQCLNTRHRPTYHQQTFLESESLALLVYLERLATSGDATGWRSLEQRILFRAEILRETEMQPCARPWLAAIWHCLPEFAAIGQTMLNEFDEPKSISNYEDVPALTDADVNAGDGGDDKGSAGKAGSAGTAAMPRPSRLALPVVAVVLTEAEKEALKKKALNDATDANEGTTPDGPEGVDGPVMNGPGGKK